MNILGITTYTKLPDHSLLKWNIRTDSVDNENTRVGKYSHLKPCIKLKKIKAPLSAPLLQKIKDLARDLHTPSCYIEENYKENYDSLSSIYPKVIQDHITSNLIGNPGGIIK